LEVGFSNRVWNEHRFHGGQVESFNVRLDIPLSGRDLLLFTTRFTVKGQRFPREIVVAPVDPPWSKVRSIKKYLEPRGCLGLHFARATWF